MPPQNLIEQVANDLGVNPSLVEKDWHVVRALSVLASLDHMGATPVFSGGTSLSKGWNLIKRFSEDIDFKVKMPTTNRKQRRAFRERIMSALIKSDFDLVGKPLIGNESRFFSANFSYQIQFTANQSIRPHIRVEMTFHAPELTPIERPVQSLIAQAQKQPPEVPRFLCIDPIETAADKLSALAWRVCTRQRGAQDDDPTVIRHIHDLAALESHVASSPIFAALLQQTAVADAGRGGAAVPSDPAERFTSMLNLLHSDKLWASEYDEFVLQVSFARPNETIMFSEALKATSRLVAAVYKKQKAN